MARTKRFQILFTEAEYRQVEQEAKNRGVTMAEVIRDFVKTLPPVKD